MFCEKCGNELNNNSNICPNCGNPTNSYDAATLESDTNYENDKAVSKKSGFKKPLFLAGVIVLIAATAFTVLATTTNIFKTPKQIYLDIERRNLQQLVENSKENGSFIHDIKTLSENTHKTERELSLNLDLDALDPSLSSITGFLNNSKLIIDSKANPDKNQALINTDIIVNNAKLFDFIAAFENDTLALSAPVLFDEYVVADFNQMENILKNLGFSSEAEDFEAIAEMITPNDLLNFDEKKLGSIMRNYGKVIRDSIKDEQVTIEKNVDFKVGEFNLNCDKLTIEFEKADIQRIVINLIDAIAEDDELYEILKENATNVLELFEASDYYSDSNELDEIKSEFSQENFKETLEEIKDNVNEAFKNLVLPEGVVMNVFANRNKMVGRTIETKISTANSDETVSLNLDYSGVTEYNDKNIKDLEIKLSFNNSDDIDGLAFNYSSDGDIDNETETGNRNFSISINTGGFSSKVFKLDTDYNIVSDSRSDSVKSSNDYTVSIGVPMMFSIDASGNLTTNNWENDKEKQFGRDIDFSFGVDVPASMFTEEMSLGGGFSSKTKNTLDVDFEFPSFDSDNSIDLANASEDEINKFIMEIEMSFMNFIEENQDLINIFQPF
ncbi:hypothetical protein RBH29_16950 [Herbivorax sp. ANBcel31]|uniref:zinc ribbon domain-containing protein n=1 Tax=Herbivorax sp. ANBcel31 TaxID=3069754 RepID=UPI0027B1E259|nr:zinc ribbon domain-containing protein [Herbivorax sp. ANBcel31]MDQ2088117.1 hypothetical protein [Herbivorax sp. ANBcel31]